MKEVLIPLPESLEEFWAAPVCGKAKVLGVKLRDGHLLRLEYTVRCEECEATMISERAGRTADAPA